MIVAAATIIMIIANSEDIFAINNGPQVRIDVMAKNRIISVVSIMEIILINTDG